MPEDEGHRVLPGVEGKAGPQGKQGTPGKQGKDAVLPGGAMRLTTKRLLIIYVAIIVGVALSLYRSDQAVRDARQDNYESCVQFRAVITDIAADRATDLELPNCERIRP